MSVVSSNTILVACLELHCQGQHKKLAHNLFVYFFLCNVINAKSLVSGLIKY